MNREAERKRLVELIDKAHMDYLSYATEMGLAGNYDGVGTFGEFASNRLLANGIVVPHVKVGQTVYCIIKGFEKPLEGFVGKVELYDLCSKFTVCIKGYLTQQYTDTSVGKTVFTSREEAEKVLKERETK